MSIRNRLCSAAAMIAVSVLVACDRPPTPGERRDRVLGELYASYDRALEELAPSYVVVTYPADLQSMPPVKHAELKVVRSMLGDRGIPHELARYDASIVRLVNDKHWRHPEYSAFVVPEAAVDRCRHGTLLYLNLDVRNPIFTKLHPVAADNDIDVKIWNDPLTLPPEFRKLWDSGAAQASGP